MLQIMNDLVLMKGWIDNPKRDYATGHALYKKYKVGSTYDAFFETAASKPDATAINMLFQKVGMIYLKLKANPKFVESVIASQIQEQKPIGSNPTPPRTVKPNNQKSGIKVNPNKVIKDTGITGEPNPKRLENLPSELQAAGERIRELTPLIGGLKAKINALPTGSKDYAKVLMQQLEKFDTEKRNLWKQIDEYNGASSKDVTIEKRVALTPSQLKDKIKNCKDSIRRIENKLPDQRKNRPALAKKSEKALAKKQKELEAFEKQFDAAS